MLWNETFLLEVFIILLLILYTTNSNILVLLSVGGLYLIIVGIWLLLNEGDIYTGFLWVIDLGVGLVFLIFILHFTSFFFQKSNLNLAARHHTLALLGFTLFIIISYFFSASVDSQIGSNLNKTWFFKALHLDYYTVYYSLEVSELNTIMENYFLLNSYPFFIVNFNLFFGLMSVIVLYFLIQRLFSYLNFSEIHHFQVLKKTSSNFFIRSQNLSNQQNTFPSLSSWTKTKRQ